MSPALLLCSAAYFYRRITGSGTMKASFSVDIILNNCIEYSYIL